MFGHPKKQLFIALLLVALTIAPSPLYAAVKDSDADGLTDQAETNTYLTDPAVADTDGDGWIDSREVIQKTNPLIKEPHFPQKTAKSLPEKNSVEWYISQAGTALLWLTIACIIVGGLLFIY